ncbi:MAG: hypothetical protein V1837_02940 [Candidatus Woesearchaeota archaeon]
MGLLDIVDEDDNVIGQADFEEIHAKGLRHRSAQIFATDYELGNLTSRILVAERSQKQKTSKGKLHPSAAGHPMAGQNHLEGATMQLRDELFYSKRNLPSGLSLVEIASYKNDTRETNKENTKLYAVQYPGPFSPNPKEIGRVFWQWPMILLEDMKNSPEKYTQTFVNALAQYMDFINKH